MLSDSDSDLEMLELLSDCDEKESLPVVRRKRYKRINFLVTLTEAEFTFRFRINKVAVELLLAEIMPFIKVTSRKNHGVSPLHQLLLTLRFYALGTMLISVADFVGVSKSTASRIVENISKAIAKLYKKYIYMHQDSVDIFFQIARFPRVLGAIDGTHIRIQSPTQAIGEEFRNRKGFFSLNVQAVCDADLKFMNVVARWPGSAHDATIFNNSVLRAQCDMGMYSNRWLLGDSAYPNRSYLLTPLTNPTNRVEQIYNESHIATRNVIERTFGVWKRRFPIVFLTLRLSLDTVKAIIIATAVLHNICRNYNIQEIPSEVDFPGLQSTELVYNDPQTTELGDITQRTELISGYFSSL